MSECVVIAAPNQSLVFAYLAECLGGSPLMSALGKIFPEGGDTYLVAHSPPPAGQDLNLGWSKNSCSGWLPAEIVGYLEGAMNRTVLVEDPISSPSDPFMNTRKHPLFWHYKGRIFWLVLAMGDKYTAAEGALAWSASIRRIAVFTMCPPALATTSVSSELTDDMYQQLVSGINRLVTDAYDGEGFIDWRRRTQYMQEDEGEKSGVPPA